jgi:hypothetical protein
MKQYCNWTKYIAIYDVLLPKTPKPQVLVCNI